jgi:DMSO/TMAO reductase YedYZ molybdopterin-dependent catalytic subunit
MTVIKVSGLVILAATFVIIGFSIVPRILIERRLRQLLPGVTSIKRIPPFHTIDPTSIPRSPEGQEFAQYNKRLSTMSVVVVVVAFLTAVLAQAIPWKL